MTKPFIAGGETGFNAWLRNNPRLDSVKASLTVTDSDLWIHKYRTAFDKNGSRDVQLIMLVEIKEYSGDLSASQRDTLVIANQLLRNRRNVHAEWSTASIRKVYSPISRKTVEVWSYGVHLLQVFGEGNPAMAQSIAWDRREIDLWTLERLLRMELDPDTLDALKVRRHHRNKLPTGDTYGFGMDDEQRPINCDRE